MTIVTVEATPREQLIADLRALAAFLEEHPALPVGRYPNVQVTYIAHEATPTEELAAVDRIAAEYGAETEDGHSLTGRHHRAVLRVAPTAEYCAVAIVPTTESETTR